MAKVASKFVRVRGTATHRNVNGQTVTTKYNVNNVMGCGVCGYGSDVLNEKNRRCTQCLLRTKGSFVLDKKYRDANMGEHEIDTDESVEYDEIMQ